MPPQRLPRTEAPPVPAPALPRDVDADAAAILTEAVGPSAATPSPRPARAEEGPQADGVPGRPAGPPDAGMNTAEYAVGTLAAVAFAGLLLKVLTSDSVQAALAGVIQRALG